MQRYVSLFMSGLLILILGCAGSARHTKEDFEDYNYSFEEAEYGQKHEGSLWTEQNSHSVLFMDHKARRVNDTVTISIVEVSNASGEATTNTGRESSVSAGITNFLGLPSSDWGVPNMWGRGHGLSPTLSATTANTFDGTGKTVRKGNLTASITARVIKVLPNGNLVIRGRKRVTINNEDQIIVISGLVRPKDISADNTVLSTYVADARIEYTGKGVLADKQRPGWLARFIDWVWPF
ncbi:MAG: flagellar basal body L-ring protein FlgH [Pseudomonadota bacterium]